MKVDAILWDYDGTLVNSVPKNIAITKQIIAIVAPRLSGINLPSCLQNEKDYHLVNHQSKNWQDLYVNYYGMTESEMLKAGTLWTEYQMKNSTPVQLFSGIKETIQQIHLPQGICSQNSSENIIQVLKKNNLAHKFKSIIGYDDIPENTQKPNPFSGIKCLNQIFITLINKTIVYVGDHEGDVEFTRNLEYELGHTCKVISIIAKYSGNDTKSWTFKPDIEIETPTELVEIINGR